MSFFIALVQTKSHKITILFFKKKKKEKKNPSKNIILMSLYIWISGTYQIVSSVLKFVSDDIKLGPSEGHRTIFVRSRVEAHCVQRHLQFGRSTHEHSRHRFIVPAVLRSYFNNRCLLKEQTRANTISWRLA